MVGSSLSGAARGGAGASPAPEITAADAAAAAPSAPPAGLYPQPLLHVVGSPVFDPQAPPGGAAAAGPSGWQAPPRLHLQPGVGAGIGDQNGQQQQQPRLGSPSGKTSPSPLARDAYPVVVHCETDLASRNASSDPTGAYVRLARGHTSGSGSGAAGVGAGGAEQQHQHMMQLASWLVPDAHHNYWALFTSLAVLGMAFAFAFMAGDYATWQRTPAAAAALGGVPPAAADAARWGPGVLAQWLRFWRLGPQTTFNPVYLYAWGARYMPAVKAGQWWRLFSSFCLHNSFTHLLTNMALFVLLTVPLEHTYGPLRIGLIFLASAFGANFLSMTFEDPCVIYVGASGAVFGFVGLAISDLLLNWDTVSAPVVRLLVMLAMLGISIAVEYMEVPLMAAGKVSHLSHIGGLLGGLFVSFAFLPNLKDRRFRAMRRFAKRTWGHRLPRAAPREHKSCWRANRWLYWLCMAACGAAVLFLYVALPVWIWVWKLPRLECPVVLGIP